MYYVYVLKSGLRNWYYVGYSADLRERVRQHNAGQVRPTKGYRPLQLVYYEAYLDEVIARRREIEIKNNNQQKEVILKRLKQNGEIA